MHQPNKITTLFLDVGGVLLTNGWDRHSRQLAATTFGLDLADMNDRHHLTYDTYEIGKLSLDEYLQRIVFFKERSFTPDDFKEFMYRQSQALPGSLEFFKELKSTHRLRVIAVNNEGRELNEYRIKQFHLHELFDAFASSCYVKFRKPDTDIYRLACDLAQSLPQETAMVDDRLMFVEVAGTVGLQCVHFTGLEEVKKKFEALQFKY